MLSNSIKHAVIKLIEAEFPTLDFDQDIDSDCFVRIQPVWKDFGWVEILEDGGQLIINWGRFTHSHIDSYDEDQVEHVDELVDGLRHQIGNVITDKVAFWGQSRGGSGGFFSIESEYSTNGRLPAYLWSGIELTE